MSKMDNLRAMREAKYARGQERGAAQPDGGARRAARPASTATVGTAAGTTARPTAAPAEAASRPAQAGTSAADAAEGLCGHRNMGGRTCTRERGHTAKSHRYS